MVILLIRNIQMIEIQIDVSATWKIGDVQCVLEKLADACPDLVGINLSGWKGLTSDNLIYLVENLKKLERLDLSSINVIISWK